MDSKELFARMREDGIKLPAVLTRPLLCATYAGVGLGIALMMVILAIPAAMAGRWIAVSMSVACIAALVWRFRFGSREAALMQVKFMLNSAAAGAQEAQQCDCDECKVTRAAEAAEERA